MRKLEFIGTVRSNGDGICEKITLPGRDELIVAMADWPTKLAPGTLSIQVNKDGFPESFEEIGQSVGLKKLDVAKFRAALVIPRRLIAGNPTKPDPDHPTRGFAQVWRAELRVIATGQAATCWMFRIIDFDLPLQLELVAEENLRNNLNLCDGAAVKVTVWEAESDWTPPTPDEVIANWCEATRGVEDNFGCEKALGYLIGEKFLNFLDVAETNRSWRQAIPTFVTGIKSIFEPWQLAEFLNTPRRLGALGHASTELGHLMLTAEWGEEQRLQEDAKNLILLEWAKDLLLETEG
jgi:hypothetical protein